MRKPMQDAWQKSMNIKKQREEACSLDREIVDKTDILFIGIEKDADEEKGIFIASLFSPPLDTNTNPFLIRSKLGDKVYCQYKSEDHQLRKKDADDIHSLKCHESRFPEPNKEYLLDVALQPTGKIETLTDYSFELQEAQVIWTKRS